MLSQVTVTAVAAPLAVLSALFALVFLRYGIPRAAQNGPTRSGHETVGTSVVMCGGNVVLTVAFLLIVVECVTSGSDLPLFTGFFGISLPTSPLDCFQCDPVPGPNIYPLWEMQVTLLVALIWYVLSLAVLAIEMSAGRSRGQRTSALSK